MNKVKFLMLIAFEITTAMCVFIILSIYVDIPPDLPTIGIGGTLITVLISIVKYFTNTKENEK